MATPTSTSRIGSNFGITTGFTDNTGIAIGESYKLFTNGTGTSSMLGTMSYAPTTQYTYIQAATAAGNITLSINATNSRICDTLVVMFQGHASTTYSVTYHGNIKGSGSSFNISPAKAVMYQGVYNGTNFLGSATIQA